MKSSKGGFLILLLIGIGLFCIFGNTQHHGEGGTDSPEANTRTERCAASGHLYGQWRTPNKDLFGQWIHSRFCTICGHEETELLGTTAQGNDLGSAGELSGTTLLVSIFADDAQTHWDFSSDRDIETAYLMREHLGAAVDWLEQQCSAYGVTARFIYEWDSRPDLYYTFDFAQKNLVRAEGSGYWDQMFYVHDHIPTETLKQKYNAQNIIYIFYFNTDEQNTVNSWSLSDSSGFDTEIINVFVRDNLSTGYYYMSASSFAHEIMHCFGAYDLYYATAEIPQAYVDHCKNTGSNDIMYTVSLGAEITQELSQLDAYYMGLTDTCDLVDLWGLGKSTHGDRQ